VGDAANRFSAELQASWSPLRDRVESMDPGEWTRTTAAGWTVREMLAHVAFWDEAAVPVVTYLLRGEEIPRRDWFESGFHAPEDRDWPPDYEHNAREASWGREHSNEEVLGRLLRAHESALASVGTIGDKEAFRFESYIRDHAAHYREHLAELAGE
jgi:hypothetical protein